MPELPEVEILVRHLSPLLRNKRIVTVEVRRARVLLPTTTDQLKRALRGARFQSVSRRGKYLLFALRSPRNGCASFRLLGHLGMTGRMFLLGKDQPLPRHTAVLVNLGRVYLVFEDTRYFGRLTLETQPLERLGPEPLGAEFTPAYFADVLARSRQPIKIKLMDQAFIAGLGNIYASEALFRAGVSPRKISRLLNRSQLRRLFDAIRKVLTEAIERGSTMSLNFGAADERDRLFYYGSVSDTAEPQEERLQVYDREGEPCFRCARPIKRLVQASRSTFYCPVCQKL